MVVNYHICIVPGRPIRAPVAERYVAEIAFDQVENMAKWRGIIRGIKFKDQRDMIIPEVFQPSMPCVAGQMEAV
jgi:hypothetical protein